MRHYLVVVLSMMCLISIGCFSTKTKVVYVSLTPAPNAGMGVLYVATNDPIDVAIQGKDEIFKRDVGGWYLLPKDDLEYLVNAAKEGR